MVIPGIRGVVERASINRNTTVNTRASVQGINLRRFIK